MTFDLAQTQQKFEADCLVLATEMLDAARAEIIRLTARVERLEGALMDIRSHYTHDQSAFAGVVARAALSHHTEEPKT